MNTGTQNRGRKLNWLLVLIIFGAIGGMVWAALPDAPISITQGAQSSDFILPDIQGAMHSLPKGEVVLLNFWATWCPPCRREIPSMATLYQQYASRGLKIIAISVDQRRADLLSFMQEYPMPFQVLHDADGSVSHNYGVYRYPESFLVDRNGIVQMHLVGAKDWMSAPILQTIDSMLAEPVGEAREGKSGDNAAKQG